MCHSARKTFCTALVSNIAGSYIVDILYVIVSSYVKYLVGYVIYGSIKIMYV